MPSSTLRSLRFARAWLGGPASLQEEELPLGGDTSGRDALLVRPHDGEAHPTWIVLHGLTRPGREHPALLRFARSLAATGASVLLPEIPEWRELRLETAPLVPALLASLDRAEGHPACRGPAVLAGFSFGCPQVLIAATDPRVSGRIAGILGFGGYADPERVVRFLFTGEHAWEGTRERLDPDPYGRWVMGANFLPRVPGHAGREPVAEILRELASRAGEMQVPADGPAIEGLRAGMEREVPPSHRELFRVFAPPAGSLPEPNRAGEIAEGLCAALRGARGDADPRPFLSELRAPVRLIHGRSDRLIPWSETLRLEAAFPHDSDVHADLTGLFAHSKGSGRPAPWAAAAEGLGFLGALRRALRIDEG